MGRRQPEVAQAVGDALELAQAVLGVALSVYLVWVLFPAIRLPVTTHYRAVTGELRGWWRERKAPEQMEYEMSIVIDALVKGYDLDRALPQSVRRECWVSHG